MLYLAPSRLGPNVLHKGVSQSDASHAAWLGVLDLVNTSGRLPRAIPIAICVARYPASALGHTRRHHRREDNPHRHDIAGHPHLSRRSGCYLLRCLRLSPLDAEQDAPPPQQSHIFKNARRKIKAKINYKTMKWGSLQTTSHAPKTGAS